MLKKYIISCILVFSAVSFLGCTNKGVNTEKIDRGSLKSEAFSNYDNEIEIDTEGKFNICYEEVISGKLIIETDLIRISDVLSKEIFEEDILNINEKSYVNENIAKERYKVKNIIDRVKFEVKENGELEEFNEKRDLGLMILDDAGKTEFSIDKNILKDFESNSKILRDLDSSMNYWTDYILGGDKKYVAFSIEDSFGSEFFILNKENNKKYYLDYKSYGEGIRNFMVATFMDKDTSDIYGINSLNELMKITLVGDKIKTEKLFNVEDNCILYNDSKIYLVDVHSGKIQNFDFKTKNLVTIIEEDDISDFKKYAYNDYLVISNDNAGYICKVKDNKINVNKKLNLENNKTLILGAKDRVITREKVDLDFKYKYKIYKL